MINNKNINIIHYILIIILIWILYKRYTVIVEHSFATKIKSAMGFGVSSSLEQAAKDAAKASKAASKRAKREAKRAQRGANGVQRDSKQLPNYPKKVYLSQKSPHQI